jgi:hypothetical protein
VPLSIWILRDAKGYRRQRLTTGCVLRQHTPESNSSAEKLIRGSSVVAQLRPNQRSGASFFFFLFS